MLILQAILLGILQGLTEFIPISSSAHLIIIPWLFGWQDPALTSLSFDVGLHLGTLLAVLVFFASDWWRYLKAGIASLVEHKIGADRDRAFAWLFVVATIPGAVAGLLGESKIDALFHTPGQPVAMAAMITLAIIIALLGLVLLLADRLARHMRSINTLSLKDAILIGCAQALAIFPGVSRSGSTITAGLALGLKRDAAARFSFMLSAPIIAGAGLVSLLDVIHQLRSGALPPSEFALFPIGIIFAAVSGFVCIKYLLRYLQQNSVVIFVYYRWALAILVILVAVLRG
jgi:undecaprenyl-diphosphatase